MIWVNFWGHVLSLQPLFRSPGKAIWSQPHRVEFWGYHLPFFFLAPLNKTSWALFNQTKLPSHWDSMSPLALVLCHHSLYWHCRYCSAVQTKSPCTTINPRHGMVSRPFWWSPWSTHRINMSKKKIPRDIGLGNQHWTKWWFSCKLCAYEIAGSLQFYCCTATHNYVAVKTRVPKHFHRLLWSPVSGGGWSLMVTGKLECADCRT